MGNIVSNLITTIWERVDPGSTYNRQSKLDDNFHELKKNFGILEEANKGTLDLIEQINSEVRTNSRRLESLIQDFPKFSWIVPVVVNKIMAAGSDMRKISDVAREKE